MKQLQFVPLDKNNERAFPLLLSLMIPYNKELDLHQNRQTSSEFIQKVTRGILDMQGAHDRHLELCYDGESLIGFLYGKVDHAEHKGYVKPGYGYIMEFYVKPEFRRKGYGEAMLAHLEALFASHGILQFYLTADPVTGKPFWTKMGFYGTQKISPENGLEIYEKEIRAPKNLIRITISQYLTHELAEKIAMAQWGCASAEWVNRIRRATYEDHYFYDCFDVIATDQNDNIIGRLHCIQNDADQALWYYGDLFVIPDYRRMGIARQMISAAITHLSERGAKTLCCYVGPNNLASIHLQKSCGFFETPYRAFHNLANRGMLRFERSLPCPYSVIPATANEAVFVMTLYMQNIEILHGEAISLEEWDHALSSKEEDEQNFLVCRGCMPVAWLRINGLLNKEIAWISMLVVSKRHQHQGAGSFAVSFAENFIKKRNIPSVGIHTTQDNIPAQKLYCKCGYMETECSDRTTADGIQRKVYTYQKLL